MADPAPHARTATVDDVPRLAALWRAFDAEFDGDPPEEEVLARRLVRLLALPTCFAVVAGAPVCAFGLITLRPSVFGDGLLASLDELYTQPALRSRGYGAAVLSAAMAEAARRGADELIVEVDEPDVDAQRFYARNGFPLHETSTGLRAFVVRRELSPG